MFIYIYTRAPLHAYIYFCICKEVCMEIPIELSTPGLIKMY